ncbi:hypothetical protein BGX26_006988 [Mortierella sp. AD094]|nr:hypothetical protein BGX26_006988 [Mortierella sp. AD094]
MSALLDLRYFPTYKKLPHEYAVDLAYYRIREGIMVPRRHWCFMGEIVDDSFAKSPFLRHRLIVKDREGTELPVSFYLSFFDMMDTTHLKTGNTIFVRYAEKHYFLDMTEGLRVEDTSFVHVVPLSLSTICDTHRTVTPNICKKCGKRTTKRCAKCKQTYYCSRECQTDNWPDHRPSCRILTLVNPVTAMDHVRFTGFTHF